MHKTGQEGHSEGRQNKKKKKLQVLTHCSLNKSVETAVAANPAPYYKIQTCRGPHEHQQTLNNFRAKDLFTFSVHKAYLYA